MSDWTFLSEEMGGVETVPAVVQATSGNDREKARIFAPSYCSGR